MEQVSLSAEDWLTELMPTDDVPGSNSRGWRRITIAVSLRLPDRVTASSQPGTLANLEGEETWQQLQQ
jgi:hypothetical protein